MKRGLASFPLLSHHAARSKLDSTVRAVAGFDTGRHAQGPGADPLASMEIFLDAFHAT